MYRKCVSFSQVLGCSFSIASIVALINETQQSSLPYILPYIGYDCQVHLLGPTMILTRRTTTVGMALLLLCFSIYLHDIFILLLLEPFSWQVIGIYFPQAWVHFHCPIAGFFRVADFSKPKSAMQLVCCVPRQKSAKLKLHASVACQ